MIADQRRSVNLPDEDVLTYLSRKKQRFNLLSFFRITAALLCTVVFFMVYMSTHIKAMQITNKLHGIETDLKYLDRENEKMQIELAKYVSMEHIDDVAVTKLNMQRPPRVEYVKVQKAQR